MISLHNMTTASWLSYHLQARQWPVSAIFLFQDMWFFLNALMLYGTSLDHFMWLWEVWL